MERSHATQYTKENRRADNPGSRAGSSLKRALPLDLVAAEPQNKPAGWHCWCGKRLWPVAGVKLYSGCSPPATRREDGTLLLVEVPKGPRSRLPGPTAALGSG